MAMCTHGLPVVLSSQGCSGLPAVSCGYFSLHATSLLPLVWPACTGRVLVMVCRPALQTVWCMFVTLQVHRGCTLALHLHPHALCVLRCWPWQPASMLCVCMDTKVVKRKRIASVLLPGQRVVPHIPKQSSTHCFGSTLCPGEQVAGHARKHDWLDCDISVVPLDTGLINQPLFIWVVRSMVGLCMRHVRLL